MSQGEITDYITDRHTPVTDPNSDEFMCSEFDSYITFNWSPIIHYERNRQRMIQHNECKCCERHQNKKITMEMFNKETFYDFEINPNKDTVNTCVCVCRSLTRYYARLYTNIYDYLCSLIHDTINDEANKHNTMEYDKWFETCVEFNPLFKPLYCSKNAINVFHTENLLFNYFKKEVHYERTIDGSICEYLYSTYYIVRYYSKIELKYIIYAVELVETEINLDYWLEDGIETGEILNDESVLMVNRIIKLI